ncbi:hypothetical protein [Fuerstiella marisgermanici]|uniref:Peptidase MA-like domain-containing protein n=1 Tax=Fuerstiella marisgermanici TaxID=1891926 RepID=A0A1P8WC62_9PLAN|nr:hypothetical protein [Fuerstiella marisgermanici]APZ91636.1 hypothetical protein Fuma_01225 [Fuerstiella marisgermanici]
MRGRAAFWCLIVAIVASGTVRQFLLRKTPATTSAIKGAPSALQTQASATNAARGSVTAKRPTYGLSQPVTQHNVTINVPSGATVILASLDQSAGFHDLRLSWTDGATNAVTPVAKVEAVCDFAHITQSDADASHSPAFISLTTQAPQPAADNAFRRISETNVTGTPLPNKVRRFRAPWFYQQRSFDRYIQASALAASSRVTVFAEVDSLDPDSPDRISLGKLAETIVEMVEGGILRHVESRIGPIVDVDDDGRLSILLCELSDNWLADDPQEPIRGCVRQSDFLQPLSPFEGDAVYLDSRISNRQQLKAVLAHELTHAAVFSVAAQSPERHAGMPNWLNEAVAHIVELEVCPDSPNLRKRFADFHRHPNHFPVVQPDNASLLATRRGPSRAAGCSFVASALSGRSPTDLSRLVATAMQHPQPLERLTGRDFAEMFRDWTLGQLTAYRLHAVNQLEASGETGESLSLAGTSFAIAAAVDQIRSLQLEFPQTARLQITVVETRPSPGVLKTAAESGSPTAR